MKRFCLLSFLLYLVFVSTLFIGVGHALEENEAMITVLWSNETLYQSSTETVTLFFVNNSPEQLVVYYVGLHFDWMDSDQFLGNNLSSNPIVIPSSDSHTFSPISIEIPEDALIGPHSYYVGIDGLQGDTNFAWDSQTFQIVILNFNEEEYNELMLDLSESISEANGKNYQSPESVSLLEQAESAYAQAASLTRQKNYNEAMSQLENASNYLEEADAKELEYIEEHDTQEPSLMIVVLIVIIAFIGIVSVMFLMKLKSNRSSSKEINQM